MNITDNRRKRLRTWFADKTLPAKEKSYLSQLMSGKASFGEKAARRIEGSYAMPPGFLDEPAAAEDARSNVVYQKPTAPGDRYPVISWVSAGAWSEAIEPYTLDDIDEWYESDAHVEGQAFWLRVKGDSMTAPVGLSVPDGMLILVDTGREAKNGSLVVAKLTEANEATFKKLVIDAGLGQRFLQPLNPTQPRVQIEGNCKIIGVAIEQRGSLI